MFTDIVAPNIFRAKNDWNIISLKSKNYVILSFPQRVAKIIKDETGYDPLVDTPWRKREVCQSRQLYLVMLKRNTGMSLAAIGLTVHKDHCTVINAIKTISNLYDTDKNFRSTYNLIDSRVKLLK